MLFKQTNQFTQEKRIKPPASSAEDLELEQELNLELEKDLNAVPVKP